ncbi:hypothetical protein DL96DRAFT_1434429, partial [Flagelloscypha sp. PMI_526]
SIPEHLTMAPFYTFTPNSTSISFPWPVSVTGTERVMLSAQGNLQKFLSAFFARPIHVSLVYSNDFDTTPSGERTPTLTPNVLSASRDRPALQTRQVYLECEDKIVCICTSTVTMSNPHVANLFLVEKYPIGQTFSKLGQTANFELIEVGFGEPPKGTLQSKESRSTTESKPTDNSALWRKYRLFVEDFECEILEVFPSRQMFSFGEAWL